MSRAAADSAEAGQRPLGSLGQDLFTSFEDGIRVLHSKEEELTTTLESDLRHQFDRFRMWAIDLGLLVPGHGSLDYRVRDAGKVRRTFETFLQDLFGYLAELQDLCSSMAWQGLDPEAACQPSEHLTTASSQGSELFDDDSDEGSMDLASYLTVLLQSIGDVIDRLFKMSGLIRNPSTRQYSSKVSSFRCIDEDSGIDLVTAFEHYSYDHVRSVFVDHSRQAPQQSLEKNIGFYLNTQDDQRSWHGPASCSLCKTRHISFTPDMSAKPSAEPSSESRDSHIAEFLVQRIARANLQRRQQFMYWNEHYSRLERYTQTSAKRIGRDNFHDISTPTRPGVTSVPQGLPLADILDTHTVTTATKLEPISLLQIDSKTAATVSEYAPSNYNPTKEILDFPPPPSISSGEKYFRCPYCFTMCPANILAENAWKLVTPTQSICLLIGLHDLEPT